MRVLWAAVLVTSLFATTSLQAANRDIERLQIQIATLQGQVTDLQRVAEDNLRELRRLNESLAELNAQNKSQTKDRRTQDEATQAALKELTEKISDLAERFQAMGGSSRTPSDGPSGAPGTGGSTSTSAPGGGVAPRELYSQAYADYARGNYDLAIQEYQEFIKNFSDTDLADNAQYWIGECLFSKQKFSEAIEAWNTLFRDYPSSEKLPDARFKKGVALEKLGRRAAALVEYRYVVDRYPNSDAGRKAREKLNPQ